MGQARRQIGDLGPETVARRHSLRRDQGRRGRMEGDQQHAGKTKKFVAVTSPVVTTA